MSTTFIIHCSVVALPSRYLVGHSLLTTSLEIKYSAMSDAESLGNMLNSVKFNPKSNVDAVLTRVHSRESHFGLTCLPFT